MSWWAIDVRTASDQREVLGAWLVARTGQSVEEREDGTLVAFAPDEQAAEVLVDELQRTAPAPNQSRRQRLEEIDWTIQWRNGLGPRQLGSLTIVPSWLPEALDRHPHTVVLDPETAFGSGEHGSTRVALRLLGHLLRRGDRVLDLGSGSGILSIAAIKLGASRATGIEIDAAANEVAVRNADRNGVTDRVDFLTGDAAELAPLVGPVDLLVSNILRSANTDLLPSIRRALRPGGAAIFSGMEEQEAIEFRRTLLIAGFGAIEETVDAGWWGIATRPE
jgi:ribosomal protein L11 methyltransferase